MPPVKTTKKAKVSFEPPQKPKMGGAYVILFLIIAMALSAAWLIMKDGIRPISPSNEEGQSMEVAQGQEEERLPEGIVDRVKRHVLIKNDEAPYIAKISNIELVRERNPEFYADASNGDSVLIWSDKAIIYSEEKDRIIAVATASSLKPPEEPEVIEPTAEEQAEALAEQLSSTIIEIRNGSRVAGAASRLKASLTGQGMQVSKIGDAGNLYDGTRIIDLTDGMASAVLTLVGNATSGTIETVLPEGEPETEANILVIIGR